jgi:hypothetical protein
MSEGRTRKDEEGEDTIAGLVNMGLMRSDLHTKDTYWTQSEL